MVHQTTNTSEYPYSLESSHNSIMDNQSPCVKENTNEEPQCTDTVKKPDLSRLKTKQRRKTTPFWAKNPNVLLNQKYVFEFFPFL